MPMNAIHIYGVVTNDYNKARYIINSIAKSRTDIVRYCNSENNMIVEFKDGTRWMWVNPASGCRGYRLHKALFDRNITFEEFERAWCHFCSFYCEGYEWI